MHIIAKCCCKDIEHTLYKLMLLLNDSCAHAVLKCLNIQIPFAYALDTQTALSLIIEHFKLSSPTVLIDCLKNPLELGHLESKRLQSKINIFKPIEFIAHLKSHLALNINEDDLMK